MAKTTIRNFIRKNYKHFNAAVVLDAADGWVKHLKKGRKMFLTMGGAMSTAELGISLAEMIRKNKVHAISTTGANLEEDIYNLIAHNHYKRLPGYRSLSADDEVKIFNKQLSRVTDTCIPEEKAMRKLEGLMLELWQKAEKKNASYFPYEYIYQLLKSGKLKKHYQINPKHSWLVAACEKNIPVFTPGWEDSTLGNNFVAHHIKGNVDNLDTVKSGLKQMNELVKWYRKTTKKTSVGFFQIGGGIAGDFPICVVPLITQDLRKKTPVWSYFAQISDSTTSYGSYSGAVPNEKITWGKLGPRTPSFIIESDATIVAPLIFNYVLG